MKAGIGEEGGDPAEIERRTKEHLSQGVPLGVVGRDPKEDEHSPPDLADRLIPHVDPGTADTLNTGLHRGRLGVFHFPNKTCHDWARK